MSVVQQKDPVAAAIGSVVIGAATGGAIICLVLVALHESPRTSPSFLNALFAGGVGGLLAAGLVAWLLARSLVNPLRRAMTAMVALGGAAFVGALTIVADAAAGRPGLLGLTGLCVVTMAWAGRQLRR